MKKLGVVLHVMDKEAIVRGSKDVPRKGTPVLVEGVRVGRTGFPFGKVESPFIPIILERDEGDIVGKVTFLGKFEKKPKRRRKVRDRKLHSGTKQHKKRQ